MTTNNLWYSDQSTWQQASLAYAYDSTNASPGLITGYWKRVRKISVYKSGSWQEVVTYPSFEQILALMGTALSGGEPEATLFNEVINGRKFGDINNSGTFSLADSTAFLSYTLQIWGGSNNLARKQYIEGTMFPTMMADQSKYSIFFAGV
jgi:hypothetical protein